MFQTLLSWRAKPSAQESSDFFSPDPTSVSASFPAYGRPPDDYEEQRSDNSREKRPLLEPKKRPRRLPPTSTIVTPFGDLNNSPLAAAKHSESSDSHAPTDDENQSQGDLDAPEKPTCSLALVCYSRGCNISHIRVTSRTKFSSDGEYEETLARYPKIITSDGGLFKALKKKYDSEICGFWRHYFSLKTLKFLRLLSYNSDTRPTPVSFDEMTMQEVLYAYNHPSEFGLETDWVEWIFRLRQPDKRHALEYIEGWNGTRIAILGTIPCIASILVGVMWSVRGGDVQTAFTVAGFILTVATVLLALLAIVSGIDSRPR